MPELYVPSQPISVGLRFRHQDFKRLDRAAEDALTFGDTERYSLYRMAADAARSGEPMIVQAESVDEAQQLAAAIVGNAGSVSVAMEDADR